MANYGEKSSEEELRYISDTPTGIEKGYRTETYGDVNGGVYREISVAKHLKSRDENGMSLISGLEPTKQNETLDPNWNWGVRKDEALERFKIAIPTLDIPDSVKELSSQLIDAAAQGKYKDVDVDAINKLMEEIDDIPEAKILIDILSTIYKDLNAELRTQLSPNIKAMLLDYTTATADSRVPDYSDLSAYLNAPFPTLNINPDTENEELKKLLEQIKDLSLDDLEIPVVKVDNKDLTERDVGGEGSFDHMASAIFNQLSMVMNKGFVTKGQFADLYSNFMVQGMQTASQFALEKANILNQSYGLKLQAANASIALLNAKTQLMLLPIQIRAEYAKLELQVKQLDLMKVQIELEKEKFPQVVAQTDLILAQTDAQRLQNEQTQVAIQQGKLQVELQGHQIEQAKEQTKQLVLNNNQTVEQTKAIDAQTQYQLKQVELADVQKVKSKAEIKLMAEQLKTAKEQTLIAKANLASSYAQLTALQEQIKAAKAQYSDTIDGQAIGGVLGAQINVNKAQTVGFERSAFNNFLSNVINGWNTKKTADIATLSPNAFNALGVDRLMNVTAKQLFNLPDDIFEMPSNYRDYLTDNEMDGTENTPSTSDATAKGVTP